MARLRQEEDKRKSWFTLPRWILLGSGVALLAVGWFRWENQPTIRDAEVFAALNALVEEDRESRWWAGL
jgi:type VI protein secretion system component VasF